MSYYEMLDFEWLVHNLISWHKKESIYKLEFMKIITLKIWNSILHLKIYDNRVFPKSCSQLCVKEKFWFLAALPSPRD